MENPYYLAIIVAAVLILFGFLMLLAKRYKRCPSNRVLVIYGKVGEGQSSKTIHGGGAFVWPLIQDYDFLHLDPMQIEVPLKGALSIENIRVNVPSVFTVAIGTEAETMQNAAIRLLGLATEDIMKQAEDIIFGQLRQVIASMSIEDINRDREKFLQSIQTSLEPELEKIGLDLINVNITDITDESGYIEAIGRKAASQAIQQAEIDVAEQLKRGAIGVAEATKEKSIQVASAVKIQEIGTKEAEKDRMVRVSQLEKEKSVGQKAAAFEQEALVKESERQMRVAVAEANAKAVAGENLTKATIAEANATLRVKEASAAFHQEALTKESERQMRIAVADANAKAVAGENLSKAAIADANATLRVKEAEAYQLGEARYREAEAAVRQAQYVAEARAAEALATKIEAEKRAELESVAKAQKAKQIVDAEAQAERTRIEAQGQAAALFAKLEAQARGEYEMLAKKAAGLRLIVEGCGGSQQAFQMLMLEHLENLSKTAATAISNIKFDKVVVWDGGNGNGNGTGGAAGFLQSLTKSLPPMLNLLRDIGGVDMPQFFGKLVSEAEAASKTPEAADDHGVVRKPVEPEAS